MNEPWKKICDGCKFLVEQTPSQHCYMFRDSPTSVCHQKSIPCPAKTKEPNKGK